MREGILNNSGSILIGVIGDGEVISWFSIHKHNLKMFVDDGELLVGSFVVVVDDELAFIDCILADIEDFSCG